VGNAKVAPRRERVAHVNNIFDGWLNTGVMAHWEIAMERWLENAFFDEPLDGAYHAGVENFQLGNYIPAVKPFKFFLIISNLITPHIFSVSIFI
jgi:hypothetical protein